MSDLLKRCHLSAIDTYSTLMQLLSLGSLMAGCIGFIVGWNSPSIVILMAEDSPIQVTASGISTLVAIVGVGHMVAPPMTIFLVDKFGRKNTMLLSSLPLLISWSLITVATTMWVSIYKILQYYFIKYINRVAEYLRNRYE